HLILSFPTRRSSDLEVLEDKWKLKYLRIHFTTRIDADALEREGKPERIRDRFPYLAELESKVRKRNQYELLPCSSLRYVTENDLDRKSTRLNSSHVS